MIAIMCTDDGMEISEYCDYRLVNKIALQKESVGYRILQMVNDKILSIGDIASFMTNVTQETIKAKIDDLYEAGIVYHNADYTEILSIIDLERANH